MSRRASFGAATLTRLRKAKRTALRGLATGRRRKGVGRGLAPNIVGVGIGVKSVGGRFTGQPSVVVLVETKLPSKRLRAGRLVPASIDGVSTDVIATGRFRRLAGSPVFPQPVSPLKSGCSIGFKPVNPACTDPDTCIAGTLGAVVRIPGDPHPYLLSNNHVLANENALGKGWPILQPGPRDSSATTDVGTLHDWSVLTRKGRNYADCAIARLGNAVPYSAESLDARVTVGPGALTPTPGDTVHKVGRSSGYTSGYVAAMGMDVDVEYEMGTLRFEDQIILKAHDGAFARAGDSGSLVVDYMTSRPVGLLFSASEDYCAANPLAFVETVLGIRF